MFVNLRVIDNSLIFKVNNEDYYLSDSDNEKVIIKKMRRIGNGTVKINRLFHDIINSKHSVQDLIDYHMDCDVDWNFINVCLRSSKKLTRVS